jgi:uncharacterized membrane protein YozB (DUF420 family)
MLAGYVLMCTLVIFYTYFVSLTYSKTFPLIGPHTWMPYVMLITSFTDES